MRKGCLMEYLKYIAKDSTKREISQWLRPTRPNANHLYLTSFDLHSKMHTAALFCGTNDEST